MLLMVIFMFMEFLVIEKVAQKDFMYLSLIKMEINYGNLLITLVVKSILRK
ncbi:hypothetical protein D3C80_1724350 [compost metagenome]